MGAREGNIGVVETPITDIAKNIYDSLVNARERGEAAPWFVGDPNSSKKQQPTQAQTGSEVQSQTGTDLASRAEQIRAMREQRDIARRKADEEKRRNKDSWSKADLGKVSYDASVNRWVANQPKALPAPTQPHVNPQYVLPQRTETLQSQIDLYDTFDDETKARIDKLGGNPSQLIERVENAGKPVVDEEAAKKAVEKENKTKRQAGKIKATTDADVKQKNLSSKRAITGFKTSGVKSGSAKRSTKTRQVASQNKYIVDPNGTTRLPGENLYNMRTTPDTRVMETDEQGNTQVKPAESIVQKLLTGDVFKRIYNVPLKFRKNKKMTDDEKIEATMKEQAQNSLFEHAASLGATSDEIDYVKDWVSGKREWGQYDDGLTEAQKNRLDYIRELLEWINMCYVPIQSQKIDENGDIVFDPRTEEAINNYMNKMRLAPSEKWLVFHQLAKYLGYSPDSNGKFLLQDSNKVPDELVRKALKDMERSMALYGHPYHMMDRSSEYGGTICYPIGVVTQEEAEILCRPGGVFPDKDPMDLINDARDDFVKNTQWELRKRAYSEEGGAGQMMVLDNYVRALCAAANISPYYYNTSEAVDRGYEDMLAECEPTLNPNADPEVQEERRKRILRAEARRNRSREKLDRVRNRTRYVYAEDQLDLDTGEITHKRGERVKPQDYINGTVTAPIRSSKLHYFEAACTFVANWAKFMGVIGFAPIVASSYVEHFFGNYYASLSNKALGGIYNMVEGNAEQYRPTAAMYAHMTTDEAVDAIIAWKCLLRVGGQEAVMLFNERYKSLTRENVRKFLQEDINKPSLFNGDKAKKLKRMARNVNDVMQLLLPGDLGFGRADAKRWLEGLMVNNQMRAAAGDAMERSFTAAEMLEMMESMGMERFIASMTDTIAGRDAAIMMRNQTLARESPITHVVDSIFRRCGLANVLVTLGIDTYFTYGINLVQNMLPLSNTISYLAVRGINYSYKAIKTKKGGGIKNTDVLDLSILEYQMGGLDEFGQGLAKNLMYDFVKIGNVGVFACFVAAVFMIIGFDEPEDDGLKYHWEEYRIGGKIGLGGKDENGNPQGIPLYRAWWLDDLTLFGLPLAYAICADGVDQKLEPKDPYLSQKLFFDGCCDVVSGASMFDLVRSIQNAHETLVVFDQLMSDPNAIQPSSWFSYAYMTYIEIPAARAANKLFVPNALRDMFKDEYDHTPYKKYKRDSTTPGKTENVDDWVDLQRRIESRYNPAYAIWNNWWQNGYLFDDGTTQKTGYLFNEMPLATFKDQRRAQFMEDFDYHPESVPKDELPEYYDKKCEELIEKISEYGDVDTALAQGFMIPYDLRSEFRDYCYRRINYSENYYNQLVQEGIRGAEKQDAWTTYQNEKNMYYNYLNEWVFNKNIPWTDDGYVKLRTDTETVYYRKSTGSPVSVFDYLVEGNADIGVRYLPKGNTPNNLALFTTPETQGRGYNYETISSWFKKGITDTQKIFDESIGKVVPYGKDQGVLLNNAIFGGTPNFKTDTEEPIASDVYNALDEPTMGYRGYLPFEESMLWDLPNYNKDAINTGIVGALKSTSREDVDGGTLGDMGKYIDKSAWKDSTTPNWYSNGGYYYSSGGYGGSGGSSYDYNPKIYSTPRQVNADRAATMYTKAPQTAHTTYLRPGYSTKGSREAYKRQDI